MRRIFVLSPANCSGVRAQLVLGGRSSSSELVRRLRDTQEVSIGEAFTFMSALYFRGKLAYAEAFARPPAGVTGVLVITPDDGLRPASEPIDIHRLRRFANSAIHESNAAYREPLIRDARRLAAAAPACEMVLLGSIASNKYVDVLAPLWGECLRFPAAFVGRGDMSRGGLLLRCVGSSEELDYVPVAGAPRRGARPPRLEPLP
jgi:hypothetical protein